MLFVLALVLGFTSLLLGAGKYGLPMFYAYFSEPLIIILNLVPPVLIIYLFYFLTGRAWAAYLITSVFSVILAIIDYLKIQIRGDPFVASDFSLVTEAGNIVSSYEITLNWKLPLAVFVIIAGTVFAAMLLKAKPGRAAFRITALILTVAASAAVYKTVYTREFIYNAAKNTEYEYNIWSDQETFISKGFIYPFIYSIRDAIVLSPDGYSAKEAAALLSEHESADIPDDKKVNIISVMLESYADLSRFDCIELAKDVYGPWHELQKESVSGTLLSNVFAAGTINTERAFLTGYSQQDNFSKNTNSFVWYLKDQGYYTEGLHNGEDWFYDRDDINRRLGFENYYFLQSFEYSNRTDAFFFKTLREMYDSRDENVPYFSYNLTYQNHGAYDDTET